MKKAAELFLDVLGRLRAITQKLLSHNSVPSRWWILGRFGILKDVSNCPKLRFSILIMPFASFLKPLLMKQGNPVLCLNALSGKNQLNIHR
jgi:hypothetical protein